MAAGADSGLFGPDSVTWRVHGEPVLAVGGLRSLFLQALHPDAIAVVAARSRYREDPWGRLHRTSEYLETVLYGTTAQAEQAAARVRRRHAGLELIDPRTGRRLRAGEPRLLRWVHVAEVESFLTTARRAGLRLTDAEVDRYYAEQLRSAALVGLDPADVPGSAAEVGEYYRTVRSELALTREAAEALVHVAAPPMRWGLGLTPARAVYTAAAATAFALLPGWARRLYLAPGLPLTDAAAGLSARGWRLALAALPPRLRESPLRRAAYRRAAG